MTAQIKLKGLPSSVLPQTVQNKYTQKQQVSRDDRDAMPTNEQSIASR